MIIKALTRLATAAIAIVKMKELEIARLPLHPSVLQHLIVTSPPATAGADLSQSLLGEN